MTETLHPEETVTTFYLIRHGHTRATLEGKLYTDPAACLTEEGVKQAQAIAQWLPSNEIDVLLSSPSLRVMSTAQIVGKSLRMEPVVVDGLDEWQVGEWEGRSYLEIKKTEPEVYTRWSADPIGNAPPGGESIIDLCHRGQHHIQKMIEDYPGKKLALVTHAGIIRSVLVYALGIPFENFWRLSVPTGSVSRIDFSTNFATVQFLSFRPGM